MKYRSGAWSYLEAANYTIEELMVEGHVSKEEADRLWPDYAYEKYKNAEWTEHEA